MGLALWLFTVFVCFVLVLSTGSRFSFVLLPRHADCSLHQVFQESAVLRGGDIVFACCIFARVGSEF